jgi:two-component system, sensor histidine kinase PdtaS
MHILNVILAFSLVHYFSFGTFANDKFDNHDFMFFEHLWSNRDSSNFHLAEMKKIRDKSKDPYHEAVIYNAEAHYFFMDGLYAEARELFENGFVSAQKAKNIFMQGKTLYNIGMCHHSEGDLNRAREYYDRALVLFTEAKDDYWLLNTKMNLAALLYNLGEYQNSLDFYIDLENKYNQMQNAEAANVALMGRAGCQLALKLYDESLKNYLSVLSAIDTSVNYYDHAFLLQKIGLNLKGLKRLDEALLNLTRSLQIATDLGYKKVVLSNHEYLADLYFQLNDFEKSKHSFEMALIYKDSLFNEEKQAQFALNDVRFNTALNLETISLQEALIYQKNRTILALAIAAAILLILLILLIRTFNKLKRNRLQLEKSLIEKDALLREIHHRVKNNLQVVSSLLNMHVRKVSDPKSKKILEEGADRVTAMAIIHKNLYQHTDLKTISLDDYLSKLCDQLFANYQAMDAHVALKTDLQPVDVDLDRLIPIGLIVNELISNAMKHAFTETQEAQISVKLSKNAQNQIELEIADNGVGMSADIDMEKSESIGMKLIRIFSQKLNSLVEISGDNGTCIKLSIPQA